MLKTIDLYTDFPFSPLCELRTFREQAEKSGYAGIWATENMHDPFLPIAASVTKNQKLTIGTGVVAALAYNAFTIAQMSWDLHYNSGEKFILGVCTHQDVHLNHRLGIGAQNKHRRLVETIEAVREIWAAWRDEREPRYESEQATIRTCPPGYRPTTRTASNPKVYLLCVEERDLSIAPSIADGVFIHPMWTRTYVDNHVASLLSQETIISSTIVATGVGDVEIASSRAVARQRFIGYLCDTKYDSFYAASGLTESVYLFRKYIDRLNDPGTNECFWQTPSVSDLYNIFVCEAPLSDLPAKLRGHLPQAATGIFPNIMSKLPRLLPRDVVTKIQGNTSPTSTTKTSLASI